MNKNVDDGHWEGCPSLQKYRINRHEYLKRALGASLRCGNADVQLEIFSKTSENRRADILASGRCCGGQVAIDITVTAVNKVPERHIEECTQGFIRARADTNYIIDKRVEKKMAENAGIDYGGKFLPFVMSTGGTMNQEAFDFMDSFRKNKPKCWYQGILSMPCTLAKMRGRMWTRCLLKP